MATTARRVLVVDNDPDVRDAVCFILENAGFTVIPAASAAEAQARLAAEIIHAAVIDIRLKDDRRPGDSSGFHLARALPLYIPFIIFTGYENLETMRTALGELGAKAILSKKRPGAAASLKRYVEQLFAEDVPGNLDLEIEGELPRVIAAGLDIPCPPGCPPPRREDVEQVLRVLFHDASAITVAPLLAPEPDRTPSRSGSTVVLVRPRLKHAWGATKVVKFGAAAEIKQEVENYASFKDYPHGQRLPRLDGEAYSRQLGGLTYSLLVSGEGEERLEVFGLFYERRAAADITPLLRRFFQRTFGELYAHVRSKPVDLAALYEDSLGVTPEKLRRALQDFHPEALTQPVLCFAGLDGSYPNPCLHMIQDGRFRPLPLDAAWCLCHGDLHARNILVDDEAHFWLIDFFRVGESHALRDFVELESDVKFNLLRAGDLACLLRFEQALLAPQQYSLAPAPPGFGDAEVDKAYEVVVALRALAREMVQPAWEQREYDYALLMHTLNVLRLRHIPAEKKEHALLAAALLCEPASTSKASFSTAKPRGIHGRLFHTEHQD